MDLDYSASEETICMSGGADGSDTWWTKEAKKVGHKVINWSFRGHGSKCSSLQIVGDKDLALADPALNRANLSLKRKFPTKTPVVNNLLRRNYYQIKDAKSLYAISSISNGLVDGGTGWAVQMFLDRMVIDKTEGLNAYVFDQKSRQWYQYEVGNGWIKIERPPVPTGIYAGIGTRDLVESGIKAIQKVYLPPKEKPVEVVEETVATE